jgi:hypothetical protein
MKIIYKFDELNTIYIWNHWQRVIVLFKILFIHNEFPTGCVQCHWNTTTLKVNMFK